MAQQPTDPWTSGTVVTQTPSAAPPPPTPAPVAAAAVAPAGGEPGDPWTKGVVITRQLGLTPPPKPPPGSTLPKTGPKNLFLDTMLPMGLEMAGGIYGATAAGRATSALPRAIQIGASMLGAGTGATIAKTAATPPGPPPSPKDLGITFATNAGGEALAPAVTSVVKRLPIRAIAARVRSTLKPGGAEAIDFMGGHVTPGQVSTSPFLQLMENVVGGSIWGRGRLARYLDAQEGVLTQKADEIIGSFGPRATEESAGQLVKDAELRQATGQAADATQAVGRRGQETVGAARQQLGQAQGTLSAAEREYQRLHGTVRGAVGEAQGLEETGTMSQQLIDLAHKQAKADASVLYDEVDHLAKGTRVPLSGLRDFVVEEAERRGALGLQLQGGRVGSTLKTVEQGDGGGDDEALHAAAKQDKYTPDQIRHPTTPDMQALSTALSDAGIPLDAVVSGDVTFRQAHEIRSALGKIVRDADRSGNSQLRGVASQLYDRMDTAMQTAAEGVEGLGKQYQAATDAWRTMKDTYEDGVLAMAAKAEPAQFLRTVIGPKGSVADITKAREVLGEEGWRTVQAQAWKNLTHAADGVTARTPKEFLAELKKMPVEQMRAIFGDTLDVIQAIKPAAGGVIAGEAGVASAEQALGKTSAAAQRSMAASQKAGQSAINKARTANPYDLLAKATDAASGKDIAKLQELVGPDGWKQVQSVRLQQLLGRADDAISVKTGEALQRSLPSVDQLKQVFPADVANWLHQFARVTATLEKPHALGGTGKMFIQLAQPGAVGTAATGIVMGKPGLVASASAVLLTPQIMASLITSPEMRQVLLKGAGAAMRGSTTEGARFASQILAYLVRRKIVGPDGGPPPPPASPAGQGPGTVGAPPPGSTGRGAGAGPLAAPPTRPPLAGPPSPTR